MQNCCFIKSNGIFVYSVLYMSCEFVMNIFKKVEKNWYNIIKNWLLLNEISEFKKVGSVVLW